jgi:hypothetical protein
MGILRGLMGGMLGLGVSVCSFSVCVFVCVVMLTRVIELDPVLESYYGKGKGVGLVKGVTTELALRGGDTDEQASDAVSSAGEDAPDKEDEVSTESAQLALRGGSLGGELVSNVFKELHDNKKSGRRPSRWSATDSFAKSLLTPLGGPSSDILERWVPLYGYQGVVWFRIDLFYTFVDAVDRLLCLDNRAGVAYNLYLMDKTKDYKTQEARDEFLSDPETNGLSIWASGPGDYSHDHLAWEWVVERHEGWEDDEEQYQYPYALFIAGPDDPVPWTWEPDVSHKVMKVVLDWANEPEMDRPDVAYLRMPENPHRILYTNQYGPWMENVCRILTAGRIPGRPGRPAIPDAWFTVKDPSMAKGIGTYGGLAFPPALWDLIVDQWLEDKSDVVTLEANTGGKKQDEASNRWHMFLPGAGHLYKHQYILFDEVEDANTVMARVAHLVEASLTDEESYGRIAGLQVYLPGTGALFSGDPDFFVTLYDDETEEDFQAVVERMVHWMGWLESKPGVAPTANGLGLFPIFLTIRPIFTGYFLYDTDGGADPISWEDPDETSVDKFRDMVAEWWSVGDNQRPPYSPTTSWIGIRQGYLEERTDPEVPHPNESKPRLLVGPQTTNAEWQLMVKMIVVPDLFISLVDEENLPRKCNQLTRD